MQFHYVTANVTQQPCPDLSLQHPTPPHHLTRAEAARSVQWLVYCQMTKELWFDSRQAKNFLFSKTSKTAMRPIQLLIQWILQGCLPRDEAGGARSW